MIPTLDIRGSGCSFVIMRAGVAIAGPYTSHGNAVAALRGVEQRLNPSVAGFCKCLGCGTGFMATRGNRRCKACQKGGR